MEAPDSCEDCPYNLEMKCPGMNHPDCPRFEGCDCGSGEVPEPIYDAAGIYCGKACSKCESELRSKFRPEIFEDANYETCEPKEEE